MKLCTLCLLPLALLPLAFAKAAPAPAPAAAEGAWKIDAVHSTVHFKIKHLQTSWTIGRFNAIAGEIAYDPAKPESSSVKVEIEVASVDTNCKPREEHLRGPDFFSAKEFPKISFTSTKVVKSGDKLAITGDLSLHGVTKSISFTAEKVGESNIKEAGGPRIGFYAETSIKRSDFGMKNMLEGASDEVGLTLAIECTH